MNRLFIAVATITLTGILLVCVFGVVALLDEFARLPFYHTLPIFAVIINGIVALVLYRTRIKLGALKQVYSIIAPLNRRSATQPAHSSAGNTPQGSTVGTVSGEGSNQTWTGSSREIEAALAKVQAIAWGFPVTKRTVNPTDPEHRSNYEAHS